ncbi:hypothetical protein ACF08N_08865 [Streptomyces sp. NPDC015127]|uniref:hypothetical protein n=1 Tax=Streptomyces sp. NPDC015127 TaxID=3364939 RepID=UPI0037006ACB
MNAARVTGNSAPEEPTALPDGLGPDTEPATDEDHVRAVWALAALTALDDIRAESAPESAPEAAPEAEPDGARPMQDRSCTGYDAATGSADPEGAGAAQTGAGAVQDRSCGEGDLSRSETSTAGEAGPSRGGPGVPQGAVDLSGAGGSAANGEDRARGDDRVSVVPGGEEGGGPSGGGAPGSETSTADEAGLSGGDERASAVPGEPAGAAAAGGSAPDGPAPDGSAPDGSAPDGSAPDGSAPGGADVRDRFRKGAVPGGGAVRRGGVDPVKGLIHRHRELCEQAVDPLEIAAGLEAHGLSDRTAARFRHRDVFSLAEEMFARAERTSATTDDRPARAADSRAGRPGPYLTPLLPGVVCALAVAGAAATEGAARLASGAIGALATGAALLFALRSGPLRARGRTLPAARLWTLWLLLYAACGQGLTAEIVAGGPDDRWTMTPAPLVALALAVAPAAWCADLFSVQARRRLGTSHGLDDLAAGTRPLLLAVLLLYVAALGTLVALTGLVLPDEGTLGPAAVLGTLLFLARLLVVHGFPEPASAALAAACAVEVTAPALLLSGRLPGLDPLARPVEALVAYGGAAAVPVLACGAAALGLAVHAFAVLARASAHTP